MKSCRPTSIVAAAAIASASSGCGTCHASPLDDVPGIGPARKKALLMHFGTAKAVRGAALADLQKAPGVSAAMARAVYDHFHGGG